MNQEHSDNTGAMPIKKVKKKHSGFRRACTVVITLVLAALAVLAFIFRDNLSAEGLREMFGRTAQTEEKVEDFTYENGSGQTFAPAGDGLAVASSSSIQLLDSSGKTVVKVITTLKTPAVAACKSGALFFDVGGTVCKYAFFDGTVVDIELSGTIVSAGMNSSGWFTVITEEAGYKGLVQVYDSACKPVYKWWSGSGYALKALVSPDNKGLAVLCADSSGGILHFFSLASETEKSSVSFESDLLFDMYYMNSSRVCAISENAVYFVDPDGSTKGYYDLEDNYLNCYSFGSDSFAAICVSPYRSGAGGTVITLDGDGKVLGTALTERDVNVLSANGKNLLVMTSGDISLYSGAMQQVSTEERLTTAKQAQLRSKGDALLLYSYSAEIFNF